MSKTQMKKTVKFYSKTKKSNDAWRAGLIVMRMFLRNRDLSIRPIRGHLVCFPCFIRLVNIWNNPLPV